eukprot:TRINITY_DN7700_c0_g1_i1.p1 TRINITY_DN7700_c0_g1~~TRINITY_DN7700_c0_g1_i1.p1  ORF type:complete len:2097 (+),score=441.12 TRINITY_DN7700_c0_g1_i1:85-6375(+)
MITAGSPILNTGPNPLSKSKSKEAPKPPTFSDLALCNLSKTNAVRRLCILLVSQWWFDWAAVAVIIVNSIVIAMYNPLIPDNWVYSQVLNYLDYVCLSLISLELVIRIVAVGLVMHPGAYLRDPWNIADVLVLAASWGTLSGRGAGVSYFRVIRVLRPLRTIRTIPGVRALALSLTATFPVMLVLLGLILLFLSFFGILGLYYFSGDLRYFCFDSTTHVQQSNVLLCSPYSTGRQCPANYTCLPGQPMMTQEFQLALFDNIGWSMLMVFQMMTEENWAVVMDHGWRATSGWAPLYFCMCVVLGNMMFLNLAMAMIAGSFEGSLRDEERQHLDDLPPEFDMKPLLASRRSRVALGSQDSGISPTQEVLKQGTLAPSGTATAAAKRASWRLSHMSSASSFGDNTSYTSASDLSPHVSTNINETSMAELRQQIAAHAMRPMPVYEPLAVREHSHEPNDTASAEPAVGTSPDDIELVVLRQSREPSTTDVSTNSTQLSDQLSVLPADERSHESRPLHRPNPVDLPPLPSFTSTDSLVTAALLPHDEADEILIAADKIVAGASRDIRELQRELLRDDRRVRRERDRRAMMNIPIGLPTPSHAADMQTGTRARAQSILQQRPQLDIVTRKRSISFDAHQLSQYQPRAVSPHHPANSPLRILTDFSRTNATAEDSHATAADSDEDDNTGAFSPILSQREHVIHRDADPPVPLGIVTPKVVRAPSPIADGAVVDHLSAPRLTVSLASPVANAVSFTAEEPHLSIIVQHDGHVDVSIDVRSVLLPYRQSSKQSVVDTVSSSDTISGGLQHVTSAPYLLISDDLSQAEHSSHSAMSGVSGASRDHARLRRKAAHPNRMARRWSDARTLLSIDNTPGCLPPGPKADQCTCTRAPVTAARAWRKIRSLCFELCKSAPFHWTVCGLVVVNAVVLSCHFFGEDPAITSALLVCNATLSALFMLEVLINLLGQGVWTFCKNPWNVMSFFVSIAALLVHAVDSPIYGAPTYAAPSAALVTFRVFRALRVLRLMQVLPGMNQTIVTVAAALRQSFYFVVLLFVLHFMFASLGTALFAGAINPNSPAGWTGASFDTFWQSFLASVQIMTLSNWPNVLYDVVAGTQNVWSALYFVFVILLSTYVMLNLFTGLLLGKFSRQTAKQQQARMAEFMREALSEQLYSKKYRPKANKEIARTIRVATKAKQRRNTTVKMLMSLKEPALFIFHANNPLRIYCLKLMMTRAWVIGVQIVLIANVISLALDSPTNSAFTADVLAKMNFVFCALFSLEFVVNVIAEGFVLHRSAYLRNPWNVLDFICLVFTIADVSLPDLNFAFFRATRTLRPLRLVSKVKSMRIAALSLLKSVYAMVGLLLVVGILWLTYAVIGVDLFGGTFHVCATNPALNYAACGPANWVARIYPNFNHIGTALLSLFQCATLQDWELLMFAGMASTAPYAAPVLNHQPGVATFFVTFVIFGVYFMLNLFTGVTVDSFDRERARVHGTALMTETQRHWFLVAQHVMQQRPVRQWKAPTRNLRLLCYQLAQSRAWQTAYIVLIVTQVLTLMIWVADAPAALWSFRFWSNVVYAIVFVLHLIVELMARGFYSYWTDFWGILNTIIVVMSVLETFVWTPPAFLVFMTFKALRVVQIARHFEQSMLLLRAVWQATPSLVSVGVLLLLTYFVFTILGMQFFGKVVRLEGGFTDELNFSTFPLALLTMFRVSTMDDWNIVMIACRVEPPLCSVDAGNCGSQFAPIFFVIFIILVSFIMLNLVIAVLLAVLSGLQELADSLTPPSTFRKFSMGWAAFDPDATGYILVADLAELRKRLGPPLGTSIAIQTNALLDIPITEDWKIQFHAVLLELCRHIVGVPLPLAAEFMLREEMNQRLQSHSQGLSRYTVGHHEAAARIQRLFRKYRLNRYMRAVQTGALDLLQLQQAQSAPRIFRSAPNVHTPVMPTEVIRLQRPRPASMVESMLQRTASLVADARDQERKRQLKDFFQEMRDRPLSPITPSTSYDNVQTLSQGDLSSAFDSEFASPAPSPRQETVSPLPFRRAISELPRGRSRPNVRFESTANMLMSAGSADSLQDSRTTNSATPTHTDDDDVIMPTTLQRRRSSRY